METSEGATVERERTARVILYGWDGDEEVAVEASAWTDGELVVSGGELPPALAALLRDIASAR